MEKEELFNALKRELQEGETLIWIGQPNRGPSFAKSFLLYFFAVPWLALSLTMFGAALFALLASLGIVRTDDLPFKVDSGPVVMSVVGVIFLIPFVAIGLGMLAVPFWGAAQLKKVVYGLSERRAIIGRFGRNIRVESYALEDMTPNVLFLERKNGTGSIYFSSKRYKDSDGDWSVSKIGFEDVSDARSLRDKLLELIKEKAA